MFNNFLLGATNLLLAASSGGDFKEVSEVLSELFDSMFAPLISIAVSLCAIWGVYLGFKFWRADDEKKQKEAKDGVKHFIVGIIVIFMVAVAAPLLITALSQWMQQTQG